MSKKEDFPTFPNEFVRERYEQRYGHEHKPRLSINGVEFQDEYFPITGSSQISEPMSEFQKKLEIIFNTKGVK